MKKLLLLLTLSCFAQFSFAQNKVVKGSVLDTSGYPIIGATIKIVGSNQATVTDMDGNFTIQDVNPKATINVSYIGMQPQTLKVTDNLKIVLNDDFQNLNDVVVIGYGSAKAKDLTSPSNPQPIGFSGILLAKRQNSFYCTYFLHNRNVADTKSPYPIKRLEVIRWFNQKSMVFNQSLS
ncbi:MAG: carboxypeptidase-like regulatory domain-containing protein [Segatella copri]